MSHYIGKYKDDAPAHRGWFVGKFMEETPRKTDLVELKYWEFPVGNSDHPAKTSDTLECTLIISGECEGFVGDEKCKLKTGDYVVIEPGTPNNLIANVLQTVTGLTVKAPSDPSAKKVLEIE